MTVCLVISMQKYHTCMVMARVGQNRIYMPYMTIYLMKSQQTIPYIYRIYVVLANPSYCQFYKRKVCL